MHRGFHIIKTCDPIIMLAYLLSQQDLTTLTKIGEDLSPPNLHF